MVIALRCRCNYRGVQYNPDGRSTIHNAGVLESNPREEGHFCLTHYTVLLFTTPPAAKDYLLPSHFMINLLLNSSGPKSILSYSVFVLKPAGSGTIGLYLHREKGMRDFT